jgi:hypothetical protein
VKKVPVAGCDPRARVLRLQGGFPERATVRTLLAH